MKQRSLLYYPVLLLGLAVALTTTLFAGCDSTIEPFAESGERYSIFARFDVSNDRNVVRVEDLRDGLSGRVPEDVKLTVRLINESTGKTTDLNAQDLEFTQERSVRNFVYNGPILRDTEYRVEVNGPDGESATATFETPTALPQISVDSLIVCGDPGDPSSAAPTGFTFQMAPNSDDQLIRATVEYVTPILVGRYPKLKDIAADYELTDSVNYKVDAYTDLQRVNLRILGDDFQGRELPQPVIPTEVNVIYAAAGPDFPGRDYLFSQLEQVALPGSYDNVDGGLGLVFSVVSDTVDVPYNPQIRECDDE
jgi:hypothetical protein